MLTLDQVAQQLADRLAEVDRRIVFAESCTAGLASARLASIPGVSQWHCGSAVTYREATKTEWLGVPADDIAEFGVVSARVAVAMATGVLDRTEEASIAAAITGHLGPNAPAELDGTVFIAVAWHPRGENSNTRVWQHRLRATDRQSRQVEAAQLLLKRACEQLET